MRTVAIVPVRSLGEPLVSFLRDSGVHAEIRSDDCGGVDPALAFTRGVEVRVADEDFERAEALLKTLEAAEGEPDGLS